MTEQIWHKAVMREIRWRNDNKIMRFLFYRGERSKKNSWEAFNGSRNLSKKIGRLLITRSSLSSCLRRLPIIFMEARSAKSVVRMRILQLQRNSSFRQVAPRHREWHIAKFAISRTPTISSRHSQDHLVHDSHQSSSSRFLEPQEPQDFHPLAPQTSHTLTLSFRNFDSSPTHSRTSSVAKTKMDRNQKKNKQYFF